MHEFCHCPTWIVIPMFLVSFWDCWEFKQKAQCFIIFQHRTSLLKQMQNCDKLHSLTCFISYHPICNLGSNTSIIVGSKQFLVHSMFSNFWIILVPFFHINPNILVNLFRTYMLIKKIHLITKKLSFPSTSLQILHWMIWKLPSNLKHNYTFGKVVIQQSWNFLVAS